MATSERFDEGQRTTGEGKPDKPDRYGEWLADDARIWRVYAQLAKEDDKEKAQRWNGGLNNLALFAALFSGITTAFIIESQNDLKPDFSELAYRVQNATAHGIVYVEEPFVVPGQARLVNCLWITSLILSLSAALIAIMGQDWVEMYVDQPVCNPRQWAEIRSFRLNGVYRWYMPGVIATAPVLLHASLFLFGIGLAVFMSSDVITQHLCILLCAAIACLYAVMMVSSVLWSSSPFRSPATMLLRRWFCAMFRRSEDKIGSRDGDTPGRHSRFQAAHAAHNSEMPRPCPAPRRLTLSSMKNYLSSFKKAFHRVFDGWMGAFRRCFCSRHSRRRRAGGGLNGFISPSPPPYLDRLQKGLLRIRKAFHRVFTLCLPDVSNGWTDIPEMPSIPLVADSLTWISSASPSPEVMQLVATALSDHVTGLNVGVHLNACGLAAKLVQYADGNWDRMGLLETCRHVIICGNRGRTSWPRPLLHRFEDVIYDSSTDEPIAQDFLVALAYLTFGFQSPESGACIWPLTQLPIRPVRLDRVCARIRVCDPVTLTTIAFIISCFPCNGFATAGNVIAIMARWSHLLASSYHLGQVDQVLQRKLPEEVLPHASALSAWCQRSRARAPKPLDNIIHSLIALFVSDRRRDLPIQSTRNLILLLSDISMGLHGVPHPCQAAVFGESDPGITEPAWTELPGDKILKAIHTVGCDFEPRRQSDGTRYRDARPILARMLARALCPPLPLLENKSYHLDLRLLCSGNLFELVRMMSLDGSVPDDLFRPILERRTLVELFRDMGNELGSEHIFKMGPPFWEMIGAIALWIATRNDVDDRLELFSSFTFSQAACDSPDNIWDLVKAIEIALSSAHVRRNVLFFHAGRESMSAMEQLRALFPESTSWLDIARKVGMHKAGVLEAHWPEWRESVRKATGFDPEQFAVEEAPNNTNSALVTVLSAESATNGRFSIMQPADVSAGGHPFAHPALQGAWVAHEGLSQGGP